MEKKSNKIIVIILSIFLVVACVYISYDKLIKGKDDQIVNDENDHLNNNQENVKKWLDENEKLVMYFTDFGNDFNYLTAKSQEYTNFLAWYLIFGSHDSTKVLSIENERKYTEEYSLSKENAKRSINNFLRNDLKQDFSDLIDFSKLTGYSEEYFYFYSDEKNYYVQLLATGIDPIYTCILKNIQLNDKGEIVVRYGVMDRYSETIEQNNYKKYREMVLEKTENAYRILSVYETE